MSLRAQWNMKEGSFAGNAGGIDSPNDCSSASGIMDGLHLIPEQGVVDALQPVAHAGQAENSADGALSFDFIFHSMQPNDVNRDVNANCVASEGDPSRSTAFGGFCFDYACSDGAWPEGNAVATDAAAMGVGINNPTTQEAPFHLLLTDDPVVPCDEPLHPGFPKAS
ncbi:unnamed protein product, partial [Trypanosoma congolense IL3000]